MNDSERQLATDQLAASRERVLGVTAGLNEEQWTFRPGEDRWSIAQCLEHVIRVESRMLGVIEAKVQESAPGDPSAEVRAKDSAVFAAVPDRAQRRQAPEPVRPTGQWADALTLLAEFEATRGRSLKFAAETEADLRRYFHKHGGFGDLDCYQWLILLGLHSERHARQMEEVKADANFPKAQTRATEAV